MPSKFGFKFVLFQAQKCFLQSQLDSSLSLTSKLESDVTGLRYELKEKEKETQDLRSRLEKLEVDDWYHKFVFDKSSHFIQQNDKKNQFVSDRSESEAWDSPSSTSSSQVSDIKYQEQLHQEKQESSLCT